MLSVLQHKEQITCKSFFMICNEQLCKHNYYVKFLGMSDITQINASEIWSSSIYKDMLLQHNTWPFL